MKIKLLKEKVIDILFPRFCFGCQKEGENLCQDCLAVLEIYNIHPKFKGKYLNDLYFATEYEKPLIKKLIQNFKYPPLIKDLAKDISKIIISHFLLLDKIPDFSNFLMIPVPLSKKKLKWRGFNQTEEIAKELSSFFKIPLISDCLFKTKETEDQVNLREKERKRNVEGAFLVKNKKKLLGKNILLVDDIFTTGATMEECAKILKESGAKIVIGIVVARAKPEKDKPDLI